MQNLYLYHVLLSVQEKGVLGKNTHFFGTPDTDNFFSQQLDYDKIFPAGQHTSTTTDISKLITTARLTTTTLR